LISLSQSRDYYVHNMSSIPTLMVDSVTGFFFIAIVMGTLIHWVFVTERLIGPAPLLVALAIMANAM